MTLRHLLPLSDSCIASLLNPGELFPFCHLLTHWLKDLCCFVFPSWSYSLGLNSEICIISICSKGDHRLILRIWKLLVAQDALPLWNKLWPELRQINYLIHLRNLPNCNSFCLHESLIKNWNYYSSTNRTYPYPSSSSSLSPCSNSRHHHHSDMIDCVITMLISTALLYPVLRLALPEYCQWWSYCRNLEIMMTVIIGW